MGQIYFLHGLDSSGQGTKGTYFTTYYPRVQCPDFYGSLKERLEALTEICRGKTGLTLIGSSYGGLMATCFAVTAPERIKQLILLAPALNYESYSPPEKKLDTPVTLIIGRNDTVTPPDLVIPMAEKTFKNLVVQVEDDDHMLHRSFAQIDWKKWCRNTEKRN
ncbi:alpha/beta fold hydrolase [Desulfomarina sp.]